MSDQGQARTLLSAFNRLAQLLGLMDPAERQSIPAASTSAIGGSALLARLRRPLAAAPASVLLARVSETALPRYPGSARYTPRWG